MIMNNLLSLDKYTCPNIEKQKLEREWERFITGNNTNPTIRSLMYDSWQRCLQQGISPLQRKTSINLSEEQTKEYVSTDPLFRMIKPVLTKLKEKYIDSGHLIAFCNPSCDIVYLDGDLSLMLKAEDMNFVVGSSWTESNAGTNAIGTSIATGFPIQVFAGEHYCQELQKWTCSATPIRDPATKKVLGILDMSGLWTVNHPYFLSAVTSASKDITGLLCNQLKVERSKLFDYFQREMISRQSKSYLVVLDRGWKVIKASPLLYELGLIESNYSLVGTPSLSQSLTARTFWEVEHSKGIWRFELTPYIYGGMSIGAVVNVIPPIIKSSKDKSSAEINPFPVLNGLDLCSKFHGKEQDVVKKSIKGVEFYKSLFDHNPDGIYSCDLQANLLDANPALERMVGYTAEELQKIALPSLFLSEYLESGLKHLEETMKGNPQEYEVAIKHKKGYRVDVKIKNFPIFIDNKIVGVFGIVKDITKNKQIEADLQSTKQQLDLFLKNTVDSIMIIDLQLNIIKVNEAFEEVFGWTEQDVIGRKTPIIPNFLNDKFTEILQKIMNNKHVMSFETIRQRKDGSLIDISSFISPIVNAKGNVTAFVCILRDITERKQMEEALKESEKRLRTLINAMPDIVQFKDGEGRWLEANDYALSCFQFEHVHYQGKKDNELASYNEFLRDTLSTCERSDQKTWEAGFVTRDEEVFPQPNGKSIIFDVIKVPIFDPDGKRKGLVIIGRDITELKQTEELLRKSEKLAVVGQLATAIGHEVKNPLTAIKGFMQLLKSTENVNNQRYLDVVLAEIDRIECITNEFMAVAKPQKVKVQHYDLNLLVGQVIMLLQPQAMMNNIQISTECKTESSWISCEENQLKQAFINILKNAIEAMPMGGEILVQIDKPDDLHVSIRFIDQGCGIPEERIPFLGEPFYTIKEKGIGLGLMICYKIIETHKGKIVIESEVNKGTTVVVSLPI